MDLTDCFGIRAAEAGIDALHHSLWWNVSQNVGRVDMTPRAGGRQPVVLPVIKVLDKAGIAGTCPELHEGDQVLSVNGHAALSNVQTVQMLREAVGPVVLAVRETVISKTPRGTPQRVPLTGLRPINQQ